MGLSQAQWVYLPQRWGLPLSEASRLLGFPGNPN